MKNIIMIIAGLLLVIAAAVAGVWYAKQDPGTVAAPVTQKPLFLPLERFVISVANEHHSRYLVLELTLVTSDAKVLPVLQEAAPLLRNALVEHFANTSHQAARQAFQDIPTVQQEILSKFNSTLRNNRFNEQIEQVLVTNVFIQ